MALSAEQRRVLSAILRVAKQRGASPKEVKAAVETGLVENNLTNRSQVGSPNQDHDSSGWRQERASLYKDPDNLTASINRFFNETRAVKDKYGNAGDLAAAVQRPAAQYRGRYQERSAQADALIKGAGGSGRGGPSRPARGTPGTPGTSPTVSTQVVPDDTARRQAIATYLLDRDRPDRPNALATALAATNAATRTETTVTPGTPGTPAAPRPARTAEPAASTGGGTFKITGPNPGRLNPGIRQFARAVSRELGETVTGADGTGHSVNTVNGRRSQHTDGDATDIPAAGAKLMRLGRAALIAAGMPRAQALKAPGGLYNVGGRQVIFATNKGGNHHDHLHIGS